MIGIPLLLSAAVSICADNMTSPPEKESHFAGNTHEFFAIKTNVVPWAAGIMNVACEMQLWNSFSVSVPLWWSPYFISRKYALRTFTIQPELRYWLKATGLGHFFGVHPGLSWYNLRYKDIRYQDSGRPLLNIGVSYGYSLRINDCLNAEFSIGAGYVNTRYDRFYNIHNGARIDTRQTSYWGIDRVELNLVYHFSL